jgi:hypothetical protein
MRVNSAAKLLHWVARMLLRGFAGDANEGHSRTLSGLSDDRRARPAGPSPVTVILSEAKDPPCEKRVLFHRGILRRFAPQDDRLE